MFLPKDKPGFDCAFVAKNKPVKCAKFGVMFCCKSCNMREKCKTTLEARAGVLNDTDGRWLQGTGKESKADGGVEGGSNVTEKALAGIVRCESESDKVDAPSRFGGGGPEESPDASDAQSSSLSAIKDNLSLLYKDKEGFTCKFNRSIAL